MRVIDNFLSEWEILTIFVVAMGSDAQNYTNFFYVYTALTLAGVPSPVVGVVAFVVISISEMTNLSVNINKVATLRNARGREPSHVVDFALTAAMVGAQGITVHHAPMSDTSPVPMCMISGPCCAPSSIEGYPTPANLHGSCHPRSAVQVTLVPDAPDALTSSAGWDVETHADLLAGIVDSFFHATQGIRTFYLRSARCRHYPCRRPCRGADRVSSHQALEQTAGNRS